MRKTFALKKEARDLLDEISSILRCDRDFVDRRMMDMLEKIQWDKQMTILRAMKEAARGGHVRNPPGFLVREIMKFQKGVSIYKKS